MRWGLAGTSSVLVIAVALGLPSMATSAERVDTSASFVKLDRWESVVVQLESKRRSCIRNRAVRIVSPDTDHRRFTGIRGKTRFGMDAWRGYGSIRPARRIQVLKTPQCAGTTTGLHVQLVKTHLTSEHTIGPPAAFQGRLTSGYPRCTRGAYVSAVRPGVSGLSAGAFTDSSGNWRDAWSSADRDWPPGDYETTASIPPIAFTWFGRRGNATLGACMEPEPVWVTVEDRDGVIND